MKYFLRSARSLLLGACLIAGSAFFTSHAMASDKLTLKDGKVIEGSVVREESGYIWFKYSIAGVEQTKMYAPDDFTKLDRDTPAG